MQNQNQNTQPMNNDEYKIASESGKTMTSRILGTKHSTNSLFGRVQNEHILSTQSAPCGPLSPRQEFGESLHKHAVLKHFYNHPSSVLRNGQSKNSVLDWALNVVGDYNERYILDRANDVLFNTLKSPAQKRYYTTMCTLRESILIDENLRGGVPEWTEYVYSTAMQVRGHYLPTALITHICDLYRLSFVIYGDGSHHYNASRTVALGDKLSYTDRVSWRMYRKALKQIVHLLGTRPFCSSSIDQNKVFHVLRHHPYKILKLLTVPIRNVDELNKRTQNINTLLLALQKV
jgi:hypothetical protein